MWHITGLRYPVIPGTNKEPWPLPWPWFIPYPTGHIGPHSDAIRVCQELPPLLPPRWTPSFVGFNVEVRDRTGQQTMDNILRERRLRWLGHVFRMDHKRIPACATSIVLAGARIQERTRSTKSELEGRNQQRPTNKEQFHTMCSGLRNDSAYAVAETMDYSVFTWLWDENLGRSTGSRLDDNNGMKRHHRTYCGTLNERYDRSRCVHHKSQYYGQWS